MLPQFDVVSLHRDLSNVKSTNFFITVLEKLFIQERRAQEKGAWERRARSAGMQSVGMQSHERGARERGARES